MVWRLLLIGAIVHGVSSANRNQRIVGGRSTQIESVPYMLSLRKKGSHICGAVVISKTWCITAAHCCVGPPSALTVRSGSAALLKGGSIYQVEKYVRHEKYRDNDDDWDICAIQLKPPGLKFSKAVDAVKLPKPNEQINLKVGTVSGWGYTEPDAEVLSPVLKSLTVEKVDLKECKRAYADKYTIHNRDACYGSGNKLKDACRGDSGGPLVNSDSVLIGIVSFGDECGYSILPGIYTDIVQFREWIKRTTGV